MTGPVADEFDLTPSPSRPESSGRRAVPVLVVLLVVAAIVGVLVKTLGDATLVFHGVDAAVELRSDLGDDRFRVVGTPLPGPVSYTHLTLPTILLV